MKKFGTILVVLAVLFVWLLPVSASAQQRGEKLRRLMENTTPVQRARFQDRWMHKQLHLTHQQASQVGQINLRAAERMQSIYDSPQGKLRKFREMEQVRVKKDHQLQQVLTGEQFAKYQAKKQEMRQRMHAMR